MLREAVSYHDNGYQQQSFSFERSLVEVNLRQVAESPRSLSTDTDLDNLLMPNGVQLSEQARKNLESLSKTNRETYESTRQQFIRGITRAFSDEFSKFWMSRYHQYTNTKRFVSRVAKTFSLQVSDVTRIAEYLSLPSCPDTAETAREIGSFHSVMFIDGTENLVDPLDRFYSRSVYRSSNAAAWDKYLDEYGWLTPDALEPSDVRYLCRAYPMPAQRKAMLLQVREGELTSFVEAMNWPSSYTLYAAPVRDLLSHRHHERLTRIIVASAQSLYTNQAIPLQVIAERIGIDDCTLFNLGERYGGGWTIPSASTIHHVIEHVNLTHIANGGVIRRTAGL